MDNSANGYEQIGSWNVNLKVPQLTRSTLREDIEHVLRGDISENHVRRELNFCEIDDLLNDEKGIREAKEILLETYRDPEENRSYLEHRLRGGSMWIPPSAFIDFSSYFKGELKYCTKKIQEVIASGKHRWNYPRYHELYDLEFHEKGWLVTGQEIDRNTLVLVKVNYKTSEMIIDPLE